MDDFEVRSGKVLIVSFMLILLYLLLNYLYNRYEDQPFPAESISALNSCAKKQAEKRLAEGNVLTRQNVKYDEDLCQTARNLSIEKEKRVRQNAEQLEALKARAKNDIANQKKALAGDDAQPIELDQSKSKPPYVVGF